MLHLTISQGDGTPIYAQLVQQIKTLIATGRLKPDGELPSVRQLAQQLVINPNTVVRTYRELETEGLVYKKRGAGTFVSAEVTPYTEEVCREILGKRLDVLIVEGINMGFDKTQLINLLQDRWKALEQTKQEEEGD
ncbi:MAG: GntR family transcriptional regulator [Candidatus Hydrogenedentota bacterium]|nr:MAG: GntR family transcriptional regulator [Candidatus Hydrogenedentota bacterium]